jgi:hypothetical protein
MKNVLTGPQNGDSLPMSIILCASKAFNPVANTHFQRKDNQAEHRDLDRHAAAPVEENLAGPMREAGGVLDG